MWEISRGTSHAQWQYSSPIGRRKTPFLSWQGLSQWKATDSQLPFPLYKSVLLPLLSRNLHVVHAPRLQTQTCKSLLIPNNDSLCWGNNNLFVSGQQIQPSPFRPYSGSLHLGFSFGQITTFPHPQAFGNTVEPWTMWGLGALTLHAAENLCVTYSQPSIYVVPPYMQIFHTCGSTSADSTKQG